MIDRFVGGWKPTSFRRMLLALIPLVFGFASLILSKGMYQSMDEIDMRCLIEGTAGDGSLGGIPFCAYMNVVYGFILRFFYDIMPDVYWYDVFIYALNSLSIVTITYLLTADSLRRNVISVCIMSGVSAYYFAMPQFTLTAGLAAIASTICVVSLARTACVTSTLVLCALAVFWGTFSSIIRFNCFLVVCAFAGSLFVLCAKLSWKRFFFLSVVMGGLVLAIAFGFHMFGRHLVQQNATWSELSTFYRLRAELVDNSGFWEEGWGKLAPLADELTAADGFDTADFRCLLAHFTLGQKDYLNSDRLSRVASKLCKRIAEARGRRLKFEIIEVGRFFWILSLIAIGLIVVFNQSFRWTLVCVPLAFVGIVCLISTFIHYVPFRLWWNFAVACFISTLLLEPVPKKVFAVERHAPAFRFLPFAALAALLLSLAPHVRYQRYKYREFAQPYESTQLPSGYLYLMDWSTVNKLARAFQPDPNRDRPVILNGMSRFPHYDDLLGKWHISQNTTIADICSPKSKVRFVFNTKDDNHVLSETCQAFAFYLGRRTGMSVIAVGTELGNGVSLLQLKMVKPGENDPQGVVVDNAFRFSQVLAKMRQSSKPEIPKL